jgi:hypothetical protein
MIGDVLEVFLLIVLLALAFAGVMVWYLHPRDEEQVAVLESKRRRSGG